MKVDLKPLIRFLEHLPKNGDLELSILKCHLLIEEVLTKIISKSAKNPSYIEEANLRFFQKLRLAMAFSQLEKETWLWGALSKLNNTRNKLAHGLSPKEVQMTCNDFIEFVEQKQRKPEKEVLGPTFGRFHWAAFKVFSALSSYAHFDPTALRRPTLLTAITEQGTLADSTPRQTAS